MAESAGVGRIEDPIRGLMRPPSGVAPEEIMEVVESVMTTIDGDLSAVNLRLFAEIESLSTFINSAKAEIAALRPDEITQQHLPTATDELEAIVGATERATNTIFEAVESIEAQAEHMEPEVAEAVTNAVTAVYEACGFQDITGQRISKVVGALQHIEQKVSSILEAFGDQMDHMPVEKPGPRTGSDRPDGHLMNGPQLPTDAVSQEDIDALLASFD